MLQPGATNLPERTPGWRGQPAYIDAAHRVHARVGDCVRTGRDTGIGRLPPPVRSQPDVAGRRADRRHPARLAAAAGPGWPLAKAEPKTPRYRILHAAARLTHSGRRQRRKIAATWPWAAAIVDAWTRITALPQAP